MSTKEDNDQTRCQSVVTIPISDKNCSINDGDHHGNTGKKTSNPYKKFDKRKRNRVILWCQTAVFFLAVGICVASFTVPTLRKSRPRGIAMWQWSMLASVLLVGPLLSKAIVKLVLFNDNKFSTKEDILYYVVELVESAWVVLWFSMILIAWLIVVDEPDYLGMPHDKSERIIKKFNATWPIINITLVTLILGSFLWLLKDLVLMRTKSSFHIKRFFVRISDALYYQSVVETLYTSVTPPGAGDSDNDKRLNCFQKLQIKHWFDIKKKGSFDASCLDEVKQEDVSCWGMKKVIDWIIENPNLNNKIIDKHIGSEEEAATAAEQLFASYTSDDHQTQRQVKITWKRLKMKLTCGVPLKKGSLRKVNGCLFEGDANDTKEIETEDFKKWMVKVYKHRASLVSALVANKGLFRTFNRFINAVLVLFIFALWLIMIRVETRKVIFVIASAIVSAAVIFGESCRKILENLLFVFVVHPYDIGDYCLIDNTPVKIKEIEVLTTIASTFNDEIRHYPNSELARKTISNYTRSLDMADVIEFSIESKITVEIIKKLKEEINRYIIECSQILKSEHKWVTDFQDCKTKMKLLFRYKINNDNFDEREIAKSELVLKIKEILDKCQKNPDWASIIVD